MNSSTCRVDVLRDLEKRQNDLLKQLDALDREVQAVLAEHLGKRTPSVQESPLGK